MNFTLNIPKESAKLLIRFYQLAFSLDSSPLWKHLGVRVCIYHPTCSQYTYEAIDRFGIFKGAYLGFKRILRCTPLHKGGHDPVPENF